MFISLALLHYGDDFHANNYTNRANNVVHEIDLRWNISNIYFHYAKNAFIISFAYEKFSYIPYLLVYKSTSCISRPPIFKVKNRISHHFRKTNEIHTNRNFPKRQFFLPENVLKTPWIEKSSGLIIRSEVYQDHNLRTY